MGYRFNPPPNWPAPPPGWTPPPGWLPDPTWPPPPPGWDLWVSDDDTASPSSTTPRHVPSPGTPRPETRPVGWPRRSEPNAGPTARSQPLPRRVRGQFLALPLWAKILIILLLIGLLPWLLIAGGLGVAGIGIVGLLRGPLPRFRVTSRASAAVALLVGLVGIGAGSALAAAVLQTPSPPGHDQPTGGGSHHALGPPNTGADDTCPADHGPLASYPLTCHRRSDETDHHPLTCHRRSNEAGAPVRRSSQPLRLQLLWARRLRA